MATTRGRKYTGVELAEAIGNGTLDVPDLLLTGVIRQVPPGTLQFNLGDCEFWVDLPLEIVHEAQSVGRWVCDGQVLPLWDVTFVEPEGPTGKALATFLLNVALGCVYASGARHNPGTRAPSGSRMSE